MAKRKASMMGMYNAEDIEETARMWCNKNGIIIYPKPCTVGTPSKWFLMISLKGKAPAQSPDELPRNEVWKKLYEYYMYYYKKYENN